MSHFTCFQGVALCVTVHVFELPTDADSFCFPCLVVTFVTTRYLFIYVLVVRCTDRTAALAGS